MVDYSKEKACYLLVCTLSLSLSCVSSARSSQEKTGILQNSNRVSTVGNQVETETTKEIFQDHGKYYIASGYGTREVHIGLLRDEIAEILGSPDEEHHYNGTCQYSDMHWSAKSYPDGSMEPGNGIFAYLRENQIFQLSFSGGEYTTLGGNKLGTTLDHLKKSNELNLVSYVLRNSADTASNYKDFTYEVDKEKGIAFHIAYPYNPRKDTRSVWSIEVFSPTADFFPQGCISVNRSFVKDATKNRQ